MWPATAWIVTGDVDASDRTSSSALRDRPGGVLAAEQQQAGRDERRVVPKRVDLVEHRRGAIAERRRARPRGTRARPGRGGAACGRARGRVCRAPWSARPRAVGPRPVQEVVVDLHHDPAAGRQRDARARPQPVAAPARRPGGDPARVVEEAARVRRALRDARARRSTSSRRRACGGRAPPPPRRRRRRCGRGSRGGRATASPGAIRAEVTKASAFSFGSRRKQR